MKDLAGADRQSAKRQIGNLRYAKQAREGEKEETSGALAGLSHSVTSQRRAVHPQVVGSVRGFVTRSGSVDKALCFIE